MAGERKKLRIPRLQGVALWAPITVLLGLGCLTTLVDLVHLPAKETARATEHRQRFTVNAATGEVSLSTGSESTIPEKSFDVAAPDEAAKTDTPPTTEGAPESEAVPVSEPPATPDATEGAAPTASPADATPHAEATPEAAPAPVVPLPEGTPHLRTTPMIPKLDANPTHTKESLVIAPAPEVSEMVDGLRLPKRGDKNVAPSALYAHPFKRKADSVPITFVVMNAGLDPQSIGLILGLPSEVTVAYSPYTHSEHSYSENLRAAGHEVWTMLPLMGEHYPSDDPGPMGIIGRMPPEETIRRVHNVLAAIPGSVGLVMPPDETASLQKDTLSPALGEISTRGLLLLSTHPTRNIDQITRNKGLADIIRRADLVLDPSPNESQIRSKLAGVLDAAKEKGEYIVVLSARPQSLQILADWLHETTLKEPFTLAPLSGIYQAKETPEAKTDEAPAPKKPEKTKTAAKPKPKVLPQDQYKQPPPKDGEKKPAEKKE